jgi:hypothetical protein
MPTIDIDTYKIDFLILESNDPKVLVLLDRSNYLSNPEKPKLEVTLPGFTGHIEVDYVINGVTVLDSDVLKLTEACEYSELADLPDGVWHITQKVCPYDEMFTKKCYLKAQTLQNSFNDLLISLDNNCNCVDMAKVTRDIIEIDILIKSAKAEIAYCNAQKATEKYNIAARKITKLSKQLNCCN